MTMASRKKTPKSFDYREECIAIRDEILYIKESSPLGEILYEFAESEIPDEPYVSPQSDNAFAMTRPTIVVFPLLDGGIAFVENEWGDSSDREHAFETWADEQVAAGIDWDEDDFVWDPYANIEGPPLASGSYIIGKEAIGTAFASLPVDLSSVPASYHGSSPDPSPTVGTNTSEQAAIIGIFLTRCQWDSLLHLLDTRQVPVNGRSETSDPVDGVMNSNQTND